MDDKTFVQDYDYCNYIKKASEWEQEGVTFDEGIAGRVCWSLRAVMLVSDKVKTSVINSNYFFFTVSLEFLLYFFLL